MKILLVLMEHDYGVTTRGPSYEYTNIYLPTLSLFGKDNTFHFDFFAEYKKSGKDEMNKKLLQYAEEVKPDICLFCLYTDEIYVSTIQKLNSFSKTTAYFFDDPWRQKFVRHWIQYFSFFSTPDYYMYRQYISEGVKNVIYTPFGYNEYIYIRNDLPQKYEVSFVGGYSSYRQWMVDLLRKAGLDVHVFGRGWKGDQKWISTEDMVDIFNQSAVNLNLSNGISYNLFHLLHSLKSPRAVKQILLNRKIKEQVKGRHYEINGCGGFQLSYFVPGLNLVYSIDKEIAVFEDPSLLAQQIKFFLKNDDFRKEIAGNGYIRSQKEHKASSYLGSLYKQIMEKSL